MPSPNAARAAEMPIEQIEDHLRHAYLCHHGRWASWDREAMRSSLREVLQEVLQEAAGGVAFWREMAFQQGNEIAAITAALDEADGRSAARVRQLEDALRPFAIAGMVRGDKADDDLALNFIEQGKTEPLIAIGWPDFTRAAQAMDDTPSPAAHPVTPADRDGGGDA